MALLGRAFECLWMCVCFSWLCKLLPSCVLSFFLRGLVLCFFFLLIFFPTEVSTSVIGSFLNFIYLDVIVILKKCSIFMKMYSLWLVFLHLCVVVACWCVILVIFYVYVYCSIKCAHILHWFFDNQVVKITFMLTPNKFEAKHLTNRQCDNCPLSNKFGLFFEWQIVFASLCSH